jgi:hypothetical protein
MTSQAQLILRLRVDRDDYGRKNIKRSSVLSKRDKKRKKEKAPIRDNEEEEEEQLVQPQQEEGEREEEGEEEELQQRNDADGPITKRLRQGKRKTPEKPSKQVEKTTKKTKKEILWKKGDEWEVHSVISKKVGADGVMSYEIVWDPPGMWPNEWKTEQELEGCKEFLDRFKRQEELAKQLREKKKMLPEVIVID